MVNINTMENVLIIELRSISILPISTSLIRVLFIKISKFTIPMLYTNEYINVNTIAPINARKYIPLTFKDNIPIPIEYVNNGIK